MLESLRESFVYRAMVRNLVKREVRGRYKGSVLGFVWNFVLPLMQILVYLMVFTIIFRQDLEDYYAYLIVGMVPWFMICDSMVGGAGSVVENSQLITKIYFPRAVIPISVVLSKFVNFVISIVIALIVIGVCGHGFSWAVLFLPGAMLILLVFCLGMALILSAANVYMRDVQYLVNVLVMVWIWLTPIMYVRDFVDNHLFQQLLSLNPLTYFIEIFQDALYWMQIPSGWTLLTSISIALFTFLVGVLVYDRYSPDFAEVL